MKILKIFESCEKSENFRYLVTLKSQTKSYPMTMPLVKRDEF